VKVGLVSRNRGKLRELQALLPGWELDLLDTTGIGEETGATFYENARRKAEFGRRIAPHGVWVLAEDSGLEVEGLGGGPGTRSARLAGPQASDEDNLRALLHALEGAHGAARRARFRCEIVLLDPGGNEYRGSGVLEGRIAEAPSGAEGFGYDPVFVPANEERTVAELGDSWKAQHSHRARAARALLASVSGSRRRG
jgi:XTP/dITP diphosphohydrolase